ncbi:stage III sporulation protein AE [Desulfuribacillus stibiiarsenatis]|uniref:Stage III sporulation protein AE n=1 Tax=Desulfuribacillus stibiiarsenatis TaxID=1390249 RepID=A0A1E5L6P2_9FIRM|nr:stage III sporulation protein AE [Desulfuribacillus stibiiarsenatis]OEH85653.1 stage III sporulation protein AE [Desulfuribacillus stibiiarsenatis]
MIQKVTITFVMIVIALCMGYTAVDAESVTNSLIEEQINRLDTEGIEQYWNRLHQEYGGYLPDSQSPSIFQALLPGEEQFKIRDVLKGLLHYLFHEIVYNTKLLSSIILLTVFSIVLENVQNAFERNAVSKVAYAIAYMVLIVLAINSFHVAVFYAREAIDSMVNFMFALIPLVLGIMAAIGNVTSVAMFHPVIVFVVNIIGTFISTIIFPLFFFSAVLNIVSALTDKYKVTHLANFLRTISLGLMGVFVTIFLGVLSIQGAAGAVADGITIRTAKFITGNFVPIVGKMFSDAADTVIGASLLLKNTVGIIGMIILLLICAFPAIKILTLAVIFNFSAAVMQPLGDSPIIQCLSIIGKSLIYIFAAVAVVGLMFFLAITIIIATGNLSVVLR